MNAERWERVAQVLQYALEQEPGQRAAFLDKACADDESLRREVESFISSHDRAGTFIEHPPMDAAAEVLDDERANSRVGQRVGPFQIVSFLGAGGMGEVYRAFDPRLEREVAIKFLPAHLSQNAELRERLEREARAISRLNHPHVCGIYDVGRHDGADYLVVECLEGETLAKRLLRGPLPADEAIRWAAEIADALHAAHRLGIIHRDVKPGNVMLTASGAKLLDFGLAKLNPRRDTTSGFPSDPASDSWPAKGMVFGTIQYMAPEQLEGGAVDARTDLFALGALLFEMVTGRKAFEGKSQASVIAAILSSEPPPVSALRPLTPRALDHVVRRCLAKNPEERWQTALDLHKELQWIAGAPAEAVAAASPARPSARMLDRRRWVLLAGGNAVALAAAGALLMRHKDAEPGPGASELNIDIPDKMIIAPTNNFGGPAVSPDGTGVVFAAMRDGSTQLYFRPFYSSKPRPVPDTENGHYPFWSADSQKIGFFSRGKLWTVSISGGTPRQLCDVPHPNPTLAGMEGNGGTWNHDGKIVFAGPRRMPLYWVPERGGFPTPATELDAGLHEGAHRWPCFLPDGKHFIYHAYSPAEGKGAIWIGSLDSVKERTPLFEHDSNVIYVTVGPGYVLFVRKETLMAQRFDAKSLKLTDEAVPVPSDSPVAVDGDNYHALFSASDNGWLVCYGPSTSRVVKFGRDDRELARIGPDARYYAIRLSPDGQRAAYLARPPATPNQDDDRRVWILDLNTEIQIPYATNVPEPVLLPVFSGDGAVFFGAGAMGKRKEAYRTTLSTEKTDPLGDASSDFTPLDVSRDEQFLLLLKGAHRPKSRLWYAALTSERKLEEPKEFQDFADNEGEARFSPDGRWVVYTSKESGTDGVYLRAFPPSGEKFRVGPGNHPVWGTRSNGEEIVFMAPSRTLMCVTLDEVLKHKPARELPLKLSEYRTGGTDGAWPLWPWWDMTSDGEFFYALVRKPILVTVINDWTGALAR